MDLLLGKTTLGANGSTKSTLKQMDSLNDSRTHLVAKSFIQEYGIDCGKTFASIAQLTFVNTLITVAIAHH